MNGQILHMRVSLSSITTHVAQHWAQHKLKHMKQHLRAIQNPHSASIICFNEVVTMDTAQALAPLFLEVLMAPGYATGVKEVLMQKKNRRILTITSPGDRLAS